MRASAIVGLLLTLLGSSVVSAGDEATAACVGSGTLDHRLAKVGGSEFEYFVDRPRGVTGAAPVLFALHGGGGSAELTRAVGYELLADVDGFVVVYPNAPDADWAVAEFFGKPVHAEYPESVRDVAYFDAMLEALIADRVADPDQVFVSGGSRSGLMTVRLVCERAGRIRAAAATRMVLPVAWQSSCKPVRPVSMMFMMGTADPLVPFAGGNIVHKDHECAGAFIRGYDRRLAKTQWLCGNLRERSPL